jgi:uncharacterized protein
MRIPSDEEILVLHSRHAPTPEALDRVHSHSMIVCRIAEQLMGRQDLGVNSGLVRAGSLLHDIGVYRLGDTDYVWHGVLGHELLREEGFSEELCRFASRHTGVGITAEDVVRQKLPIPVGDYLAETPEERLVMYADKFHTKSEPPTYFTAAEYESRVSRYGDDKPVIFRTMVTYYGEPDLPV